MTISGVGSSWEDPRGKNMTIGVIGDITKSSANGFYEAPADDALGGSETEVGSAPPRPGTLPRG